MVRRTSSEGMEYGTAVSETWPDGVSSRDCISRLTARLPMPGATDSLPVEHDTNAATARATGRERDIVENFTDKRMDVTVSS